MPEVRIKEIYVSCIEQKINGRVYGSGDEVPDAHALPTLAALLNTKRIRITQSVVEDGRNVADLGTEALPVPLVKKPPPPSLDIETTSPPPRKKTARRKAANKPGKRKKVAKR